MGTRLPILYSFRRCPYAMRARLALRQAGVTAELREVVLRHKPEAMLAISPKGTVPVLQLPDGQVLDESLDIMRWALRPGDITEDLALIATNDGPFKALLDRYKYPERHPGHTASEYREQAIGCFIGPLEQRLSGQTHLMGPNPSLADLAIMPFVRQFAQVDADWFASAALPGLQCWLQHWTTSSLFNSVMDKHPPWQPGDSSTHF